MALEAGVRLGAYEVLGLIGAGGMGEVYRARDTRLGRDVAVKVIPEELAAHKDRLRRFEQEARATAALSHPNILAVFDVGVEGEVHYIVAELLEGQTLRERLRRERLPVREAVDCGMQIARGLAAAHERGIVHRDLKPANVFLTRNGHVKLLDFGLAKLRETKPVDKEAPTAAAETDAGTRLGTVGYMSPEQARGEAADARSDIFSLGVVLYEMLAGRRAFSGGSAVETLNAILTEDPPAVSGVGTTIPVALDRVIRRCLEKRPEARFQSAHDVALALEAASAPGSGVVAVPKKRWRPWQEWALRAGLAAATIGALAIVFVAGRRFERKPVPSYHQLTFRRGIVNNARFARGGESVVYDGRWEDDQHLQLYAQRLDAIDARSLALPDLQLLAVGPSELAVEGWLPGDDTTLSRVPLEGGGLRKVLGDVGDADWSPDGASLAVSRSAHGREWIEFPIGKTLYETKVGAIGDIRVSPDGRRVAFVDVAVAGDSHADISVVGEAGRKTTLSAGWSQATGLAWSVDGKELWFTASRTGMVQSLYAVNLEGQERLLLSAGASLRLMDISRDGRVLLAEMEQTREARGAPDGTHERSFSWFDSTNLDDLSADGEKLLFDEGGEAGGPRYTLYLRRLADPMPTRLGEGSGLGLSPDGAWALAYVPTGPQQLRLVPTGVGETRTLPLGTLQAIESASWFPDGRRILVVGHEAGRPRRLFIQEVPDGLPRAMTPEGTAFGVLGLSWSKVSPDGRFVVARRDDGPSPRFALFPTTDGAPVPIRGIGERDVPVRWSGDGRFLFVQEVGATLQLRIERLDLQTGRRQPWKELRPPDSTGVNVGVHQVLLAPDGGAYFYNYFRILSKLYLVDGLR